MKVSTQAQLDGWLDAVARERTLVAPVDVDGRLLYRQVTDSTGIRWGFQRTTMSPKTWTLPATEPILTIEQGAESVLRAADAPAPTVVFGVRPCDARGAMAIDALFLGREPSDGRYAQHRDATTLIGLACPQMWETCFCTVTGGAPNGTQGLDVLLTEIDADYAVQAITARGEQLVASLPGQKRGAVPPQPTFRQDLPVLRSAKEWMDRFNELYWDRLGERCLGCRICTFVCPACRCFDVRDEVVSRQPGRQVFERLRAWDACTVSAYRRIAGGHNPRPTQSSRLRNRFYCKFAYYPEDFGPLGCVGCGRCIDACPVGIDVLEVIAAVGRIVEGAE